MAQWEIGQVDALITATLQNDAIIKTKMGITGGNKARVSLYRAVKDAAWFPYIYGYSIMGPDAPGQGRSRIQSNPFYDIEVRTIRAPTDDTEAIVDRINAIMDSWNGVLTPDGNWAVSARRRHPISIVEPGESDDIYYTRRGGSYMLQIVRS